MFYEYIFSQKLKFDTTYNHYHRHQINTHKAAQKIYRGTHRRRQK